MAVSKNSRAVCTAGRCSTSAFLNMVKNRPNNNKAEGGKGAANRNLASIHPKAAAARVQCRYSVQVEGNTLIHGCAFISLLGRQWAQP